MKRIIILCLLLALVVACQPTPDADIVPKKDMTIMIEQAKQTPASDTVRIESGSEAQATDAAHIETALPEERVQLSFTGKTTDDFRVEVDATVTRPNAPLPIVRVSPGEFDEETANRFFRVLTEGCDFYSREQLDTAPALDQKIQNAMDEIANGNDEEPMKDYLNELMEKRKTAPDTIGEPVKEIDLITLNRAWSVNEKRYFLVSGNRILQDGKAENSAEVYYSNSEIYEDHALPYSWWWLDQTTCKGMETVPEGFPGIHKTPIEAEAKVNALLEKLELSDIIISEMRIVKNDKRGDCAYVAICLRSVDGIPVTFPEDNSGNYEGSTYPSWGYERVIIYLNDGGIVFFSYKSPLVVENTVVAESNLLPFDEIMDRFQVMMRTTYEWQVTDPSCSEEAITYIITDIDLSLQRINEEDNVGFGLLVPVWNFWGYRTYVSTYDHETYTNKRFYHPILSINAVTGSVIDPVKGY